MSRVLAIDQGTTSTKAAILHGDGTLEPLGSYTHRQYYPSPGWVEHDAEELLANIQTAIAAAGRPLDAIGIANQGETVVAWDAASGRPIHNAIVWQDVRTQARIEELRDSGAEALTLARAGLPLESYFSASKLRWLLDAVPEAAPLRRAGRLRLGTTDAFFIERLTGVYATDASTASRTSLLNLADGRWDDQLCGLFGVPLEILPEVRPTAGSFGALSVAGMKVPLTAAVVDQQAALFGHGCHTPGQAKVTFGTGAFALAVAGERPIDGADRGALPTVAWQLQGSPRIFAAEGGVHTAGAAIDWLHGLGLFTDYREIDGFDRPSALERDLVFVPALAGLATPHWDRGAAGLWLGMGLDTDRRDLCQAVLEGIALRTAEVVCAIAGVIPLEPSLSVDGGLSKNDYFVRYFARAVGKTCEIPATSEMTALGTAQLAMLGAGLATSADSLPPVPPARRRYVPDAPLDTALVSRFGEAVGRCRNWRRRPGR
jgi:glycerol kinase